jgi:hypothetical protein
LGKEDREFFEAAAHSSSVETNARSNQLSGSFLHYPLHVHFRKLGHSSGVGIHLQTGSVQNRPDLFVSFWHPIDRTVERFATRGKHALQTLLEMVTVHSVRVGKRTDIVPDATGEHNRQRVKGVVVSACGFVNFLPGFHLSKSFRALEL